ncbi:MAG: metalloregulator ArsR/SmtB family transcription factor [Pseudomonadota bacterium]
MSGLSVEKTEQILRAAGEPTRLRLLHICAHGEYAVSDLTEILQQSQPRVSRHLKILCDAGLLERFRDGHFVYFRLPTDPNQMRTVDHLLAMTDAESPVLAEDRARLRRSLGGSATEPVSNDLRRFNRLILDQFLSHPVGDLLDIGVGSGAVLRLLAARATFAVGIDIDASARRSARRLFARRSLPNCTVREGDMYRLAYSDNSFDTVVLDEVLATADAPRAVLVEAIRVLREHGRVILIEHVEQADAAATAEQMAVQCAAVGLHCGVIRQTFDGTQKFLVASAERATTNTRKSA